MLFEYYKSFLSFLFMISKRLPFITYNSGTGPAKLKPKGKPSQLPSRMIIIILIVHVQFAIRVWPLRALILFFAAFPGYRLPCEW